MGKKAKEHRKKVAKRNAKLNEQKKSHQKKAMDYLMKLIRKEKEKGMFDGPVQPSVSSQTDVPNPTPTVTTTDYNGPQI